MKNNKKQVLKEIIAALMDNNNQVLVETVNAHPNRNIPGVWRVAVGEDVTETPLPRLGNELRNSLNAKSVKIGKDISIKFTVNGNYIIHAPSGQVRFGAVEAKEAGVDMIWGAALRKYREGAECDFMHGVKTYMRDDELRHMAHGPIIPETNLSKFARAKQQLEQMGIQPNNLMQYYQMSNGRYK